MGVLVKWFAAWIVTGSVRANPKIEANTQRKGGFHLVALLGVFLHSTNVDTV
jgi:hypothetical protein